MPRTPFKLAFAAAALVLLGAGCPSDGTPQYGSTQESWSELTDDQRASIRSIMRPFSELKDKEPEEIRAMGPITINVFNRDGAVIPFPEEQFELVTPEQCPDDCPDAHYVGANALTLDLQTLKQPPQSCEWGVSPDQAQIDNEQLIRWFEEYEKRP